ncbi:protein-L-isoaspartate(D-aspartate) O-methyltransferase [Sinimarinibacterium sp. CAU 1509]|uniref:protein-L-isoaspartate(D-aspartate) O-methyltransferase n=1 Tax=Sinimarinibacterium sp. CAU 1509 TaxID=2562283 RepID=UPI0010AD8847|nr:protein-L-isoaspartate(D-aspartate) O-methyltransferase [Sinimarinibacterium sp. CAU 1509]TJY60913.1 protein-L-isoaspartate(D-aspartate) O-methyltransferase [Sinimarinibacterium sp. CAU 1509]
MSMLRSHRGAAAPATSSAQQRLVEALRQQGVSNERVLAALGKVPRHQFVDDALKNRAYENNALPIGHAQTISQPLVVAMMTQALLTGRRPQRVLEVGTGSGYQTAVLAELVTTVFTVERIKPLSEAARRRLAGLNYRNIHFGYADGINGWPPYAPYDGIIVTAGAAAVPEALIQQLSPSGRLIIPVGPQGAQSLRVIDRRGAGIREQDMGAVSFVPLLAGKV